MNLHLDPWFALLLVVAVVAWRGLDAFKFIKRGY